LGRGGPQIIPRPARARIGGPPPWAGIEQHQRTPTLGRLVDTLARRRSPQVLGAVAPDVRSSAVLCLLYEENNEPHVVLTRRSPTMRQHAHEVSFPGGRHDGEDLDLWTTALREAEEEVALDPTTVTPVGALDRFVTVGSRTLIHPFVAVCERRPQLTVASPAEVEAILHVSFTELLRDDVWREEIWELGEHGDRALTFFELVGDTVWGATGAMLRQLLAVATGTDETITGGPG
jgi:8-oxo-dGTP pyrophosphatase MutT (NUDIX family)